MMRNAGIVIHGTGKYQGDMLQEKEKGKIIPYNSYYSLPRIVRVSKENQFSEQRGEL
jgi:hypothetical protein